MLYYILLYCHLYVFVLIKIWRLFIIYIEVLKIILLILYVIHKVNYVYK